MVLVVRLGEFACASGIGAMRGGVDETYLDIGAGFEDGIFADHGAGSVGNAFIL